MKFLNPIKIFLLCLALLSLTACSDNNAIFSDDGNATTEQVCGASQGNIVAASSFAICSKDIAYNVLYMVFNESFSEYSILNIFVDSSAIKKDYSGTSNNIANPDLANKAYAANIGGAVLAMMKGFTQLILFIAAILHTYSTISILWRSMLSGEFLQGMSKVWVVGRAILSIALITPLGDLNIVQIAILGLAMLAINGANYFMGVFLSKIQTDAMSAGTLASSDMFDSAVSESTSLVSASLCQIRTTQALRQSRFSDASDLNGFFFDATVDDQFKRLGNCIVPDVKIAYGGEKGTAASASFANAQYCKDDSNFDATKDGYGYQCGGLSFALPDITITTTKGKDLNNDGNLAGSGILGFNIGGTSVADASVNAAQNILNSTDVQNAVNGYYSAALSAIKSGNTYDYTVADSVMKEKIKSELEPLFNQMVQNKEYDYETAVQVIGAVYSNIFVKLMGANAPTVLNAKDKGTDYTNKFLSIAQKDLIWDFEKYSSKAAESLVISHCLRDLNNNYKGLQAQTASLSGIDGMKYTDFLRKKTPTFIGECSWVTPSAKLDRGSNPKFEGDTAGPTVYNGDSSILLTIGSGQSILQKLGTSGTSANANDVTQETDALSREYLQQAQAYKLALATYFYSVRKGVQDSFAEIIKDKKVDDTQVKMRQQGWASLGGYIMSISANQTNVKRILQTTTNGASWSGYGSGDDLFVNKDGFIPASRQVGTLPESFKFNIMFFGDYFASGDNAGAISQSIAANGKTSESVDTSGMFTDLLLWIENWLTSPMKYLKQAGGMPLDKPLRIGVQECFENGNCYNGSMHPVNAIIYMGQDLIDISINLLILKAVVNIIIWASDSLNGDGSISKAGWITKLFTVALKVLKVLAYIATPVKVMLDVLLPFILLMLGLGIFFCYIVPLMPYMAFLVLFIGWVVLIITMMFAMPIWALMMSLPGPTGESRANLGLLWSYFGQILVRPSLMVIGTIIGWYFSVVSLYFINLTLFGVLGPVSEAGSGTITGLISVIMFYVAYMVVVFVALKHSFSIISTFPDKVGEVMNIQPGNDQRVTESLMADRLVQTIVATHVMKEIQGMTNKVSGTFKESRNKKAIERRDRDNIRDLFDNVQREHNGYSDTSGRTRDAHSDTKKP